MVAVPVLFASTVREPKTEIADQIRSILAPLLVEQKTGRTPRYLDNKVRGFRELLERAAYELLEGRSAEAARNVMVAGVKAFTDTADLVKTTSHKLLLPSGRRALLSSIESRANLAVETLRANDEGRLLELLDPLAASYENMLKADMCISAVVLVLRGEISHWEPKQLNRLCRYADRYMVEVEDAFLAYHPELRERLGGKEETITLEQLERELGLSD